jgi:hypothetical protein
VGALALLLALTASFYWKLTISGEWSYLEAPDLANQVRPWLDFQAREFHAGRFPLWDPYEWGGHSLIGQDQPGLANPLNWILFAMPLRGGHLPIATLHWYWVLIHWLAAVFCFALCRDLGCSRPASILGGGVFALCGFMGHTDWTHVLMGAMWIPLVLLFFLRVVRGERPRSSAALCGATLGVMFLGTHPGVPVFTAVLMAALWGVFLIRHWRRIPLFALFLVVWLGVAGAQVLPSMEYARQTLRWAGALEPLHWNERVPFSVHAQYSLDWSTVAGMALPGISGQVNPNVGLVAIALAIWGISRRWKQHRVRWIAAVAAGGFCLALGAHFPPYWLLWRYVPMVEKVREPGFAIVLCQAGIAVLAAFGLSAIRRPWIVRAAMALFLAEAVYNAPRFSRFDRPGSYQEAIRSQEDIAEYLKAQPGWFRVDFDEDEVSYNFGDFHGIEQFGGLVSSMPERTHRLLGHEETPHLFGIRYWVRRKPLSPSQVEVFRSRSGLKVFHDWRIADPIWARRESLCPVADYFRVLSRSSTRVEVEAYMACPGLLMVGDAYFTGWRAWVDGRRTPVQEVDAIRAVPLEPGRHTVVFRYRPVAVYWGFGAAILSLLVTLVFWIQDRHQPSKNSYIDNIAVF